MFGLKATELLIIFVIILLLFGSSRLPQLGKSLGSGIRNFKRGLSDREDEEIAESKEEPRRLEPGSVAREREEQA